MPGPRCWRRRSSAELLLVGRRRPPAAGLPGQPGGSSDARQQRVGLQVADHGGGHHEPAGRRVEVAKASSKASARSAQASGPRDRPPVPGPSTARPDDPCGRLEAPHPCRSERRATRGGGWRAGPRPRCAARPAAGGPSWAPTGRPGAPRRPGPASSHRHLPAAPPRPGGRGRAPRPVGAGGPSAGRSGGTGRPRRRHRHRPTSRDRATRVVPSLMPNSSAVRTRDRTGRTGRMGAEQDREDAPTGPSGAADPSARSPGAVPAYGRGVGFASRLTGLAWRPR